MSLMVSTAFAKNPFKMQDADYAKMVETSLISVGNNYRLKNAIEKIKKGEKVWIAALGGSVTEGAGPAKFTDGYAYQFFRDLKKTYAPGDGKNVLTVGGVKSDGERVYFSSIGPTYDGRIKPDVMSFAYAVTVASPGNNFYESNGTSYACPSLAGMTACLWQALKTEPASKIRSIIKESSNNYYTPNNEYGYGIPDFKVALDMMNLEECDIFEEKTLFSVFPNPSDGNVELMLNYEGNVSVQVFDMLGKKLYDVDYVNDNCMEINGYLSSLDNGVYMVKVIGGNDSQICKLIKY